MNETTTAVNPGSLRVTLVQPALPKYRLPVFRLLSQVPGFDLTVVYGEVESLQNVRPEGFKGIPSPRWDWSVGGWNMMVHPAEFSFSSRRHSDVIILRWSPRSIVVWLAAFKARLSRIPLVLWGHGYSKTERIGWGWFRDFQARLATSLVFYDAETRDAYVAKGFEPKRLFVAPNTIDCSEIETARAWWEAQPERLIEFRQQHNIAINPIILFVSRITSANRVDLLIQATAELVREFPNLKTVIIGDGGAERENLQELTENLRVEDHVVFRDGIYEESKLAPWFLSATVFCYPENVGLSLLHAFAYSLPVVTSDNRSVQNPEIVALRAELNGATYTHRSVKSLVSRLREIISNSEKRKSMSAAALNTVANDFTIQRMVDGLVAAIRFADASLTRIDGSVLPDVCAVTPAD